MGGWHDILLFKCFYFEMIINSQDVSKVLQNTYENSRIQNPDDTRRWWGREASGTLVRSCWECSVVRPPGRQGGAFPRNYTHHPASSLLGVCPKELKTYIHIKPGTRTLFTVAKTGEQPRCPSRAWRENSSAPRQWTMSQHQKEMSQETLKPCYQVRAAILKRLCIVWLQP